MRTTETEQSTAKAGEGNPRRHALLKGKPLVDTMMPTVTTLYENLRHGASLSGNHIPHCNSFNEDTFQEINLLWALVQ